MEVLNEIKKSAVGQAIFILSVFIKNFTMSSSFNLYRHLGDIKFPPLVNALYKV